MATVTLLPVVASRKSLNEIYLMYSVNRCYECVHVLLVKFLLCNIITCVLELCGYMRAECLDCQSTRNTCIFACVDVLKLLLRYYTTVLTMRQFNATHVCLSVCLSACLCVPVFLSVHIFCVLDCSFVVT